VTTSVANDLYLFLPKGDYAKVKANVTMIKPLIAPIKIGQVIGKISFNRDGKIIHTQNLVASSTVDEAGIFVKMIDSLKLMLGK
jgi:D-alanyl-D-alanine carboxypeptidase (penicillin-binding protein 5/6)